MTPDEAGQLLAHAAAFDNRKPSNAAASAWAAALPDVPLDTDTLAAVARYYGQASDNPHAQRWLQPHHVRHHRAEIRAARITAAHPVYDGRPGESGAQSAQAIRALHRAAADGQLPARPIRAALGPGDTRPSPRTVALLAAVGRHVPAEQPQIGLNPLGVPCPHCHVPAGTPCTARRRKRRADVHPSRLDAARATAAGQPAPAEAERQAEEQRRIAAARNAAATPRQAAP